MGFLENLKNKIDTYQYESGEKEKGKNLFLLGKPLPEDANYLIMKGYEKAKRDEETRQINLIKMQNETEKLKLKQKLDKEKLEVLKIKNEIKKNKGDDDFSF